MGLFYLIINQKAFLPIAYLEQFQIKVVHFVRLFPIHRHSLQNINLKFVTMNDKKNNKVKNIILTGTIVAGSVFGLNTLNASATDTFRYSELGSGAELRSELLKSDATDMRMIDLSCGEDSKAKESKSKEAKCGEGKCGEKKDAKAKDKDKKKADAKSDKKADAKADKKDAKASESKSKEAKCGEGKCGM